MEHVRKVQLWRDITGRVLEKGAELAETYDMTSQQRASHLKKRSIPIRKTAEAAVLEVNEEGVSGEQPKAEPQMAVPKPHVDVTSQEPPQLVEEKKAERYALPERGLYPLDSYVQVKEASAYFDRTFKFMPPPDRHEYALNLVQRARELSIYPGELAEKYGAATYAPHHDIEVCLDARRRSLQDETHLGVLDKLAEGRFVMDPEDFAVALQEFDKAAMLEQHYGYIPDAYYTTFGKTAEEASPEESVIIGNEYVTRRNLEEFFRTNVGSVKARFGCELAEELVKEPKSTFESLPRDQKLVLMRMANSNSDATVRQGAPVA
ncbi:MAG: hypothetical protein WC372_09375 [Candidatus Neomarinimicrobiota bacterium]|jgi:hypothetical protein